MYSSPSTAAEALWGGFFVAAICSFYGFRWLVRGIRNDILDGLGHPVAARSWFIVGGVLMQAPLAVFAVFAVRGVGWADSINGGAMLGM